MPAGKMTLAYKAKSRKTARSRKRRNKSKKIEDNVDILMKQMNAETKTKDIQINEDVSNTWENMENLFKLTEGTQVNERQGQTIIAQKIKIRGYIKRADNTQRVRLLVVMFESAGDASIANILEYVNGTTTQPYQGINSFYKMYGDCKFTPLADKEYVIDNTKTFAKVRLNINIPRKRALMKFTGTGDDEDLPQTNLISVFAVSDSTVTTHPTVKLNIRQKFLA